MNSKNQSGDKYFDYSKVRDDYEEGIVAVDNTH
jgi:hypothetical protein